MVWVCWIDQEGEMSPVINISVLLHIRTGTSMKCAWSTLSSSDVPSPHMRDHILRMSCLCCCCFLEGLGKL